LLVCLQVLSDDVAPEFSGHLLLHSPPEQLHAVLYLPHAHNLHGVCVRVPGNRSKLEQINILDVDKVSVALSW
jgi:hypothetical protein